MRVKLTQVLKEKILKALKDGFANVNDFTELHPKKMVCIILPDNGREKIEQKDYTKLRLTRELKVKMLKALKDGFADIDDFKELRPPSLIILKDNG